MSVSTRTRARHRHSPRVRRLAAEAGIELAALTGTGPAGRVTPDDVRQHSLGATDAASRVAAPAPVAPTKAPAPGSPTRLTSVIEVDVTALVGREDAGLLAHVAAAVLPLLRRHPALDGSRPHGGAQHLAVRTDADGGPVVAVVPDAGDLTVAALGRRLGEATRLAGSAPDAGPGTAPPAITLVDGTGRGTLWDTPSLPPGQGGALGVGAVVERVVVRRGADDERGLAIRSMVHLALAYDPDLVDGVDAARFLTGMAERLDPQRLATRT